MFNYLKTCKEIVSLIYSEMGIYFRDLSVEIGKNRVKLYHENDFPENLDFDLNELDGKISLSLLLNQSDNALTFAPKNDFDVGGEMENQIFRTAMVKKFGAQYFDELVAYMLEKNCQQVELLTNKTLNKIKKLRSVLSEENDQ